MKTKIFLGMLLVGVVPLRAQDYYVVTKENVDVYQYPAAGEVVGKVGTMNSFTVWEAGDGWMEFKTPIVSGYVPAKYLRKTVQGSKKRKPRRAGCRRTKPSPFAICSTPRC